MKDETLKTAPDMTAPNKKLSDDGVKEKTPDKSESPKASWGVRIWSEVKFFLGLGSFMMLFLTFVWGHYKIPSESMLPTLEVGDHLYVSKFAYGFSRHSAPFNLHKLPFLKDGQIFSRDPKRGDVTVFRNPKSGIVMIKRVIGLPGDKVRMHRGRLYINNIIVPRTNIDNYLYRQHPSPFQEAMKEPGSITGVDVYEEQWPDEDAPHLIYEQTDLATLDNTKEFLVPEDTFFFMGDNRDNSTDSRADSGPGFVPRDHLIGRAELMMFSFKRCAKEPDTRCPPLRFMKPL